MARILTKDQKDQIKRGQKWICGRKGCGKSIKTYGQVHHKDGNPENDKIGNHIAYCKSCHLEYTRAQGQKRFDFWKTPPFKGLDKL